MKRILCLMLVIVMLLSLVACGSADDVIEETTAEEMTNESVTDISSSSESEKQTYKGEFKVGFGRIDITPALPIVMNTGDKLTKLRDPIYATTVAVSDGETTALIVTLDVKNMGEPFYKEALRRITMTIDVETQNIMMSATHNHSAPTPNPTSKEETVKKWTMQLYNYIVKSAKEAIKDLSDAEIYVGTAKAEGLAFVRRYFHEDGTFSSIHYRGASSTKKVRSETEADPDLQMIRFVRAAEDKKDILMCNWQCHVAHAIQMYPETITSDLVYYVRDIVEKEDGDILVAYYQGASGNINTIAGVPGTLKKGGNHERVGKELANIILDSLDTEIFKRAEAGKVNCTAEWYMADYRQVDEKTRENVQTILNSGAAEDTAEYNSLLDKFGFKSKYEVRTLRVLMSYTQTKDDLILGAISFGDVSFASVPYEMFDTNGMQVKEGSPYDMTFILTCAGGGGTYTPAAHAVPNGGYEVYSSLHKYGTAEEVVAELLRMLNAQAEQK